jgi:hypothetical protein
MRTALGLISAVLLGACSGEAPVPEHPTWVDDVQPILRGNCLNCHGTTASKRARVMRWDVCDLRSFASVGPFDADALHEDPDDPMAEFIGAKERIASILVYVEPKDNSRALMPPLPSPLLTARQTQVLQAWKSNPICGQRAANHKPTASWLQKPMRFTVDDADHDQVLGTITCGAVEAQVLSTGAHDVPAGAAPPCRLALSDGQDAVTVPLEP